MHRHALPQLNVAKELTRLLPVPNSVCSLSSSVLPILLQALVLNRPSSHPIPRALPLSVLQCDVTIRELMLHILRALHPCFCLIHTHTHAHTKRELTHMLKNQPFNCLSLSCQSWSRVRNKCLIKSSFESESLEIAHQILLSLAINIWKQLKAKTTTSQRCLIIFNGWQELITSFFFFFAGSQTFFWKRYIQLIAAV